MNHAAALYETSVWRFWLFVTVLMVGGGGLGASTSVGFIGLMLAPLLARDVLQRIAAAPMVPALAAAAIGWTALSLAWSPYDRPDQAIKLALLSPLYMLAAFAALRLSAATASRLLSWLSILLVMLAGYFLIEAAFDAPLASWVKVNLEGYVDPEAIAFRSTLTLARGVTGFIVIAGPCALFLAQRPGAAARAGAGLILAAALIGGFTFQVEANLLALFAGAAAAVLAWRHGGKGLGVLLFIAAGLVILGPVYMGAFTALFSDDMAASLPLSWHMRLEIWRYALEQIAAAPVTGHGLDAARILGEDAELRGVPFNLLPLHTHNGALHIWLETGLIGAALFTAALAALGQACWRSQMSQARAAGLAFAGAAYLATVLVGSGVWQEWLHGCLALGCAASFMIRRPLQ